MGEFWGCCAYCCEVIEGRDKASVTIENVSRRENAMATVEWEFRVCQKCLEKILPPCFKGDAQ